MVCGVKLLLNRRTIQMDELTKNYGAKEGLKPFKKRKRCKKKKEHDYLTGK